MRPTDMQASLMQSIALFTINGKILPQAFRAGATEPPSAFYLISWARRLQTVTAHAEPPSHALWHPVASTVALR